MYTMLPGPFNLSTVPLEWMHATVDPIILSTLVLCTMALQQLPILHVFVLLVACETTPSDPKSSATPATSMAETAENPSVSPSDTGTSDPLEDTHTPTEDTPETDTGIIDTGSNAEHDAPTEPAFEKSAKRGLSYDLLDPADFAAIETGVTWWYNWYFRSDTTADFTDVHEMQFVPMLWGYNPESDYVELESWLIDHPDVDHLLVLNEPNLVDQANMTPSEAVSQWLRYEQFQDDMRVSHSREIDLVGPAITWGTMTGFEDPVAWMDAFYAAFMEAEGREPRIDALAFHWYDYGLDGQLTRLEKYGKKVWVTEMANWHIEEFWVIDTPEKQIETMTELVNTCETRDDVERYAWFMGRWDPDPHHTSLFGDGPGELTAVGEHYLALPW